MSNSVELWQYRQWFQRDERKRLHILSMSSTHTISDMLEFRRVSDEKEIEQNSLGFDDVNTWNPII